MRAFGALTILIFLFCEGASGAEYYHKKWFDYPDPLTAPQFRSDCAKWITTVSFKCSGFKCRRSEAKICVNPIKVKVALLRRDVEVVVSGPEAGFALRNAVEGYVAACVAAAIAASVAGPQTVAAPAAFFGAFKTCILSVSVSGILGSVLNQLSLRIDTSHSHWAPI